MVKGAVFCCLQELKHWPPSITLSLASFFPAPSLPKLADLYLPPLTDFKLRDLHTSLLSTGIKGVIHQA